MKTKVLRQHERLYDLYKADGSFEGSIVIDHTGLTMVGKVYPDAIKTHGRTYVRDCDGDYIEGEMPR